MLFDILILISIVGIAGAIARIIKERKKNLEAKRKWEEFKKTKKGT